MHTKSAATFILITMFIESVGFGVMIPVLPDIFKRYGQGQDFVATWYGYFVAIYALMQFLASPLLGSLSDRFGRRPVLLNSLFFGALDYLLMAFAPNLVLLFAGRILAGLTGAVHTVASAYTADLSTEENRARNFGLIGAAFGSGFIAGPLIGGIAGHYGGPSAPFVIAAVMSMINFAFGYFVLPESLPQENRRSITRSGINPFLMIRRLLAGHFPLALIFLYALLFFAGQVHPSTWTLFTQYQFKWNSDDVGISLALVGVSMAVVQGALVKPIIDKLGEKPALTLGLLLCTVSYTLFAFMTQSWMAYVLIPLFGLAGVTGPVLQSMISAGIPSNEQGELQGSLMAIGSLVSIVAPLIYTGVFSYATTRISPPFGGASYLLAGAVALLGGVYWLPISFRKKRNGHSEQTK